MRTNKSKGSRNAVPTARHATRRDAFNPDMLSVAREAQRLSQSDLAKRMGVSQPLVGKWEAGLGTPSEEQITSLATALAVQPELFFVDRARRLSSMSDFYHRALTRAKRRDVKAIHARCALMDILLDRIIHVDNLREDLIPDIDPQECRGDIEGVAEATRKEMGIGPGPIRNLVLEIERCGAIVIDRQLEVDEVDALCRWVPELPKLFYLNGAKPADRIRFSLAHELGHTVMHFGRDVDQQQAERQADSFAAAFLMPADGIRRDFRGGVSITDLAAIKRKWRVSMQAAARRAFTIGIIDERRFQSLCIQMSRKGWRKNEPIRIDGESPTVFAAILQKHLDEGYSGAELAKLLLVSEETVDRMIADANSPTFQDNGVRLRVVRDDL